jgi:hypothetical protein
LEFIKSQILKLANKINAPDVYLPTFGSSEDFARPHIEKTGNTYHWVVVERGQELERKSSDDINEILFHVFQAVTFEMACKWEVQNRKEDEDSRIQLFQKQEELLKLIDEDYYLKTKKRHDKLLRR